MSNGTEFEGCGDRKFRGYHFDVGTVAEQGVQLGAGTGVEVYAHGIALWREGDAAIIAGKHILLRLHIDLHSGEKRVPHRAGEVVEGQLESIRLQGEGSGGGTGSLVGGVHHRRK